MNQFKRGQKSKEALNIGRHRIYPATVKAMVYKPDGVVRMLTNHQGIIPTYGETYTRKII